MTDDFENVEWRLVCSEEKFNQFKDDQRFIALLTLARLVNALRFCQTAAIDAKGNESPAGTRQIMNSFLFASAVLHEGLKLAERLGQYFSSLESFREGFAVLLRDKDTKALRHSSLKLMRNKFVFHFDREVVEQGLKNIDLPQYEFAIGFGSKSGEMYFGLADEVVINYMLEKQPAESDTSHKERYCRIVKDTSELMGKFAEAAEKLMNEVLLEMGWHINRQSGTKSK